IMHWAILCIWLPLSLAVSLVDASEYSRDESKEDAKTEFNLASTLTGGITSNRHHQRAHLGSQLGPQISQQPFQQPSPGYGSAVIDAASGHENGGSGIATLGVGLNPNAIGVGRPTSLYPTLPVEEPQRIPGYPTPVYGTVDRGPLPSGEISPAYAVNYPNGIQPPGYPVGQPGLTYPGVYLPQFPTYPAYPVYPAYSGYGPAHPGNVPVAVQPQAPSPPTSYQNQQISTGNPRPGHRDHWNRSFTMNTEYKEKGEHKGPFDVLNNHSNQGYGSGFGGGYNGAFSRPGY
ncbi:hypothetical protein KR222_001552, partial [Zaprionus bogoriensis]